MSDLLCSAKLGVMTLMLLLNATSLSTLVSVTSDRTRLTFSKSGKPINTTLCNNDPKLPYLVQNWTEDEKDNGITSPLTMLSSVQHIDSVMNGQVRMQGMPDINKLPADRENMLYSSMREIPPRPNRPNTLQIALQMRIRLFWRPKALEEVSMKSPWQHKMTLTRSGQTSTVNNPTPYYVIISNASAQRSGNSTAGLSSLVIEPKTMVPLGVEMGSVLVLTYVNNFGTRTPLFFRCNDNNYQVDEEQSHKG